MSQPSLFQRDTNRDTNRDIQDNEYLSRRDGKRDKSGAGISDTPPMSRLTPGHVPNVPMAMSRQQRARAFNAWVAAGKPWPPPAGLTSALAGACLSKRRERRW